jgi:hypothetical protein
VFSIGDRFGAAASKAKLIGRRVCGVIAMFDLEANKAIALRLVEVFNNRRLDLLEDVLHPEFRARGISAGRPRSRT